MDQPEDPSFYLENVLFLDASIIGRVVVVSEGSKNGRHPLKLVQDREAVYVAGVEYEVYALEGIENLRWKLTLRPWYVSVRNQTNSHLNLILARRG